MLKEQLQEFWNAKKFATSWIISTGELEVSLQAVKDFAQNIINITGLPIDNNPDFRLVKKEDTKYISVDQIRDLQRFLYTTSTVGEYKFAVIYEADLMNNNAANCCLKILEEPPRDSYIFLLTTEPNSFSATIRSRCHKLFYNKQHKIESSNSYEEFIASLLELNVAKKISILQEIATKSKKADSWGEFCQNATLLISKLTKYHIDPSLHLTPLETRYLGSLKSKNNLYKRLDKLTNLVEDTSNFDLDKRQMGILILECLV